MSVLASRLDRDAPLLAGRRNLAIAILRLHGDRNIAAALRHNAATPPESCHFLGIPSP